MCVLVRYKRLFTESWQLAINRWPRAKRLPADITSSTCLPVLSYWTVQLPCHSTRPINCKNRCDMIRKNPFRFHKTSLCQHQNNRSDIAFPLPVYTIWIWNEIKFSESIKNRLLRLFVSRFLTVKTRKIRLSAAYVCCEIGLATADVICI